MRVAPPDLVAPTALSRLLTQRAVQQIIFLAVVNKDEVSGRWLGAFAQRDEVHGLSPDFHGLDALPVRSERYVCDLLAAPPTLQYVRQRRVPTGGSPNNPFLQKKEYDEVALEIVPKKLAERVMAMRELVAKEWRSDLQLFGAEDEALRSRHRAAMRAGAEGTDANAAAASFAAANTLPPFEDGTRGDAERSSPFRLASYDLLKALATREAMRSVLRRLGEGSAATGTRAEQAATAAWLERWWEARRAGFVGHRPWRHGHGEPGVADAMLRELVAAEPLATTVGGGVVLVDPLALSEAVLDERRCMAAEWTQSLARVPEAHLAWRRWHLEGSVR